MTDEVQEEVKQERTPEEIALLEAGAAAEQFMLFIKENPFFKEVIEGLDADYVKEMLGLPPGETEKFKYLQTKRQALYEPFARVQTFLSAAQKLTEELQGIEPPGGIL